jgi:hypothetical protein
MPPKIKIIDVINMLHKCSDAEGKKVGQKLSKMYNYWTGNPSGRTKKFFDFFDLYYEHAKQIAEWVSPIHKIQYGKIGGFAFEEYVYELLQKKFSNSLRAHNLHLLWGEEVTIWEGYISENHILRWDSLKLGIDMSIIKKIDNKNIPIVCIECKSLLKLDYFRESAFKFSLLKKVIPQAKSYVTTTKLSMKKGGTICTFRGNIF